MIELKNVSKVYQLGELRSSLRAEITRRARGWLGLAAGPSPSTFWALRDVSLKLEQSAALGIIGPNGSGKTTILKLISGVAAPTRGQVLLKGRVAALLELGAGFHPELTGRENIYLKAAILGLRTREIKGVFDRIVEFSGLEKFLDTPVKRYSSGMYVRLGFSVAAHVEAEILLVDEVLAVGDSAFRQRCARRVQELTRKGTTIVLVSHNLHLLQSICPRSVFIADGKIAFDGDSAACIAAYQAWQTHNGLGAGPFSGKSSGAGLIREIRFGSTRPRAGQGFDHGDPFEIDLSLWLEEPLPESRLVVRFVRSDGVVAAMLRADDYGYSLQFAEGTSEIRIELPRLQLASGHYYLEIQLGGALDGVSLATAVSELFEVQGLNPVADQQSGFFVPDLSSIKVRSTGATTSEETSRTR